MLIGILLIRIIIIAAMLRFILIKVAEAEADVSWGKVLMTTALINVGTSFIEHVTMGEDPYFVIGCKCVLIIALIMSLLWVSLFRSILVILLYTALHFGVLFGVRYCVTKMLPPEKRELMDKEIRRERVKERAVKKGKSIKEKADRRRKIDLPDM
jgi:hypothetical protein